MEITTVKRSYAPISEIRDVVVIDSRSEELADELTVCINRGFDKNSCGVGLLAVRAAAWSPQSQPGDPDVVALDVEHILKNVTAIKVSAKFGPEERAAPTSANGDSRFYEQGRSTRQVQRPAKADHRPRPRRVDDIVLTVDAGVVVGARLVSGIADPHEAAGRVPVGTVGGHEVPKFIVGKIPRSQDDCRARSAARV